MGLGCVVIEMKKKARAGELGFSGEEEKRRNKRRNRRIMALGFGFEP